ncbi:hypothetical protein ACOI1H_21395 [Loktanella sp. DJP18]|uniref:hypothetical protein n=1 Tax=Loktanella sp. DJP18 TaxID=3409788 RepID=UPI003BB67AA6
MMHISIVVRPPIDETAVSKEKLGLCHAEEMVLLVVGGARIHAASFTLTMRRPVMWIAIFWHCVVRSSACRLRSIATVLR